MGNKRRGLVYWLGGIFIAVLFFSLGQQYHGTQREYIYIIRKVTPPSIRIDDPRLIRAIIKVESAGNHRAVSNRGAIGLMQVRWSVWKKELSREFGMGRKELFIPHRNIEAGRYILAAHYKQSKGDLRKTLSAYSGGATHYYERVIAAYFEEE